MLTRSQIVSVATALLVTIALAHPALAQSPRTATGVTAPRSNSDTAIVLSAAPIYLLPDASREPLRVAAPGSALRVIQQADGWCNVQFQDPQFGLRTGYVEARYVRVERRDLEPMNLSVPGVLPGPAPADAPPGDRQAANTVGVDGPATSTRAPADTPRMPRAAADDSSQSGGPWPETRQGFWFNAGLGYGSGSCSECLLRYDGLSGGLTFGGRLSDRWLMGVGTTGWTQTSVYGDRVSVGTVDARFRFYPVRTSGFFVTMGLGLGSISVNNASEVGIGSVLGLGWDIRVGRKVSLTPFWNGFAVATQSADANVGQIGLGVTVH